MTYRKPIPVDLLRSLFHYDPRTGVFTRKVARGTNAKAGEIAGSDDGKGYLRISISGRLYFCHRLAWAFSYGEWPEISIDHINGNPSDNRISNLRIATPVQNGQNQRKAQRGCKSGLLGAYIEPRTGRYYSQIKVDGRIRKLGTFATADDAHQAYLSAKREQHAFCSI